jgi:hypothetical protein
LSGCASWLIVTLIIVAGDNRQRFWRQPF